MSELKCVVFDIDDTLYLERDYVRSGFARVGEWVQHNLGIPSFSDLAWCAFEAGSRGAIFDLVLRRCGVDPAPNLIRALVDIYRTHEPRIELCPDAHACLEDLRGRVTLGAVSDGPIESQRAKAETLGLVRWMDQIVFTASLGAGFSKPSPHAFELVQKRAGCSGPKCVYVADNPIKDFTGPKSLGWNTVRVRRVASLQYARNADSDVDVEVPDLRDAMLLLEQVARLR